MPLIDEINDPIQMQSFNYRDNGAYAEGIISQINDIKHEFIHHIFPSDIFVSEQALWISLGLMSLFQE